jgi:thymidylate kinase
LTTVALIGPDGAGKSSIIRRVTAQLPVPVRSIYMGVNLESSKLMLPTTRLALEAKRRRGGRPDMVGASLGGGKPSKPGRRRLLREARSGLRLANWIAEEWFRQAVAWAHQQRGRVVLFDRHFFCDYYANDVAGRRPGRPWTSRVHGAMLERWYPRPDLVILLDAPAEVLFARKGEGTIESLERMRQDLLELVPHVDRFVTVDATKGLDAVTADVIAAIMAVVRGEPVSAGATVPASNATPAAATAPAEGSQVRTDAA